MRLLNLLILSYYAEVTKPSVPEQWAALGAAGHRASPFDMTSKEWYILAIGPAICAGVGNRWKQRKIP